MRNLLLLATLVPSLVAGQGTPLRVPASVDTLPNGLTLIIHEDHSVPIVTTNVWYHVGSGDEKPGRTGFAHLFEHLMFMGSQNAPYPQFDRLLEAAGANNNGSTTEDRTNYYEDMPSNALPLALWLDADRMGWLIPTMDSAKVDLQRDVVKNERRQSYDNQPYGRAYETLLAALEKHNWNQTRAAAYLDITRSTLLYRMQKFGLERERRAEPPADSSESTPAAIACARPRWWDGSARKRSCVAFVRNSHSMRMAGMRVSRRTAKRSPRAPRFRCAG